MVLINEEDDNVWLAHVSSVKNVAKTCQVFFYIPCTRTNKSDSSGQIYVKDIGYKLYNGNQL